MRRRARSSSSTSRGRRAGAGPRRPACPRLAPSSSRAVSRNSALSTSWPPPSPRNCGLDRVQRVDVGAVEAAAGRAVRVVPEVDAGEVRVDVAQHAAAVRAGLAQRARLLARDLARGPPRRACRSRARARARWRARRGCRSRRRGRCRAPGRAAGCGPRRSDVARAEHHAVVGVGVDVRHAVGVAPDARAQRRCRAPGPVTVSSVMNDGSSAREQLRGLEVARPVRARRAGRRVVTLRPSGVSRSYISAWRRAGACRRCSPSRARLLLAVRDDVELGGRARSGRPRGQQRASRR